MPESGLLKDMEDLARGRLAARFKARLDRIEELAPFRGDRFDPFGANLEALAASLPAAYLAYRRYFRAEVRGLDRSAGLQRGLIAANHIVMPPIDAACICAAFLFDAEPPRFVRTIVSYDLASRPFMGLFAARTGQVAGAPENAERLFAGDRLVLVFPEGGKAFRTYANRYRLADFNIGFVELALRHGYPIVPTAVIGAEDAYPILAEAKALKGMGFRRFPVTPTFPLLGPLGLVPLPARIRIFFGEPMDFSAHAHKLGDPTAVRELARAVRSEIQSMLDRNR